MFTEDGLDKIHRVRKLVEKIIEWLSDGGRRRKHGAYVDGSSRPEEVLMEVLGSLPAFRTVLAPDRGSGEDGATTSGGADGDGAMAGRLAGSSGVQ